MLFVLVGTGGPAVERAFDGLANPGIAMAQERSAVAAAKVDVLSSIKIPESAALGPVEVHRMADAPIEPCR